MKSKKTLKQRRISLLLAIALKAESLGKYDLALRMWRRLLSVKGKQKAV